jgi:pyruvate dehydrogenase E2 component (dihydrolipoamide acetyltransferase)
VIGQILVQPWQKVPVGTVLALIQAEGVPEVAVAVTTGAVPLGVPEPVAPGPVAAPSLPPHGERIRVSPLARKLADKLGVDLRSVQGTGSHGAIERIDVERAAELKAKAVERKPEVSPAPSPPEITPLPVPPPAPQAAKPAPDFQAGMRRAIAAAMSRSNRDIPHYYLEMRIDMSRALHWLEAENQKRSIKDRLLPVVLLIKATAQALVDVPELNGYWVDDQPQPQEAINIGFAISLRQGGLVTPAIHQADLKSLDELMADMRDIITRTRAGRLRSSDMTDATITLTSLGDLGVEKVYGVIYPPQVALVGFGKIGEQPWVENGMFGIRPVITATLAGDHRATDGHRGGQFLEALNRHLQEPEKL